MRLAATDTAITTILTGLAMLARAGRITLEMDVRPLEKPLNEGPWHLREKAGCLVELFVDERHSALIDVHDSWEVDSVSLARHDVYFKRSLQRGLLQFPHARRIHALGLVNDVRSDGPDRYEAQRILRAHEHGSRRALKLLRWIGGSMASGVGFTNRPVYARMHHPPRFGQEPRILFMTGLWDPEHVPAWAPHKRAEFEALNETRAALVAALRREFGPRFHGGLRHSAYARRRFPDRLLPTPQAGSQRNFLQCVKQFPICVTTTGLHGSNGFKLAEFVAHSRAIVSEPLHYAVPGQFTAGRHYLEFRTVEDCVGQAAQLVTDADARHAMMERNWRYWQEWLRPDRLAWRIVSETRAASEV